MLLQEVSSAGLPVSIDARSIETIEPAPEGTPLCLVGLRSGRTLWVRSAHGPLRERWREALASVALVDRETVTDGWRAGMREAAHIARSEQRRTPSPAVREPLGHLVEALQGLADDGP